MTPSPSLTGCMDDDVGTGPSDLGSAVSTHTPDPWGGPWTFQEYAVTMPGCGWVDDVSGATVGQYIDLRFGSMVAAAPEMHAALTALQEYAIKHVPVGEGHHHPVWVQAANALAKAEGRAALSQVSDSERSSYVPTDGDNQP